ncbi:MAG TPA: HAMP domain-containing sensor histidine kinase [Gaiellaceae bacterium]|nr:HAMP domain-containing sensor histidine kinase [Gaiellaceae bacterium]
MTPFRGVGGRLALALLTIVVGVLAIVYLIVVPSYQRSLENAELNSLSRSMTTLAIPDFSGEYDQFQQFAEAFAPVVNARVLVLDLISTQGPLEPIADSSLEQDSSLLENDTVALRALREKGLARGIVTRKGQRYAEVAFPFDPYVILFSAPLHDQLQTVDLVKRRFLVAGAIATLFAILAGYAGSAIFARRLRRLEAAAERIAAGDFDEPVVDAGDDEVGQLARAFERMRLRIATLDRARGEFIANASHELRTPLFSLAGFLELLDEPGLDARTRDEFLGQMREQVERLTKLATDLLDLSRLDAGRLAVQAEIVDLPSLAAELALEFAPRAAAAEHRLDVAYAQPAEARADAARVLQIGRILVENALVHTPPGTVVRLETRTEGGRAVLAVANDGPPIPGEAQRQIFERFYRLDGTRASGSGLGLAIARELAEVMDGRIELETRDGWTRFALVLPADLRAAKSVKTAQPLS